MDKDKHGRVFTYLSKDMLSVVDFELNKIQADIPIKPYLSSNPNYQSIYMNSKRDKGILQTRAGLSFINCKDKKKVTVEVLDSGISLEGTNQVVLLSN